MSIHFLHPLVSVFDQLSGHSPFRALAGPSGPASQAGKPGVASRRCFPGHGHNGPSSLRLPASSPFPAIGPRSDVGGLSSCCRSVFHCWITKRAADGPPLGGSSGIWLGCVSYSSRLNRRARRAIPCQCGRSSRHCCPGSPARRFRQTVGRGSEPASAPERRSGLTDLFRFRPVASISR